MTTQFITRSPQPRVRALGLALTLGAATLGLTVVPALPAAAQTAPTVGIEVDAGDGSSSTAIDIQDLYPGSTQEAVLFLTGSRADEVDDIALTLSGLQDFENGCNRPETNTGDTSCGEGPDQGELSRWLAVTYTGGTETTGPAARACTIPAGTPSSTALMSDLATLGPVGVAPPAGRSDGDVRCVVIAFHHEDRGPEDNVTQTDSVRFDLRIDVSGDLPPQVGGIQIPNEGRPAPGEPSTPGTPAPGGPTPQQPVVVPIEVGGEVIEKDPAPAEPDQVAAPDGPRTVHPDEVVTAGDSLMLGLPRTGSTLVVELLAIALLLLTLGAFALQRRSRNDQEVSS